VLFLISIIVPSPFAILSSLFYSWMGLELNDFSGIKQIMVREKIL